MGFGFADLDSGRMSDLDFRGRGQVPCRETLKIAARLTAIHHESVRLSCSFSVV